MDILYIANDGTQFTNRDKCEKYENMLDIMKECFVIYNHKAEKLDDITKMLDYDVFSTNVAALVIKMHKLRKSSDVIRKMIPEICSFIQDMTNIDMSNVREMNTIYILDPDTDRFDTYERMHNYYVNRVKHLENLSVHINTENYEYYVG